MAETMEQKVRVAIADQRGIFVGALQSAISSEQQFLVQHVVDTMDKLMRVLSKVDVTIIGQLKMPQKPSLHYGRLKKANEKCKLIVIKDFTTSAEIKEAMEYGVDACLLNKAKLEDLFSATNSVLNNKRYLCDICTNLLFDGEIAPLPGSLTRREKEVLTHIVSGHTNAATAKLLFISESTVDFHRKNIYQKLNVKNTVELIKYAIREGVITLN